MRIDASELRELARDLRAGAGKVEPLASKVVRKTALDIEADGKQFAPVDTGNLMGSITTDVDGLTAEIGPTAEYGGYVEYGTSKMSAQPYMGPAAERRTPGFVDALGQVGTKIL
jgi:HK97 gp10 family phage protein